MMSLGIADRLGERIVGPCPHRYRVVPDGLSAAVGEQTGRNVPMAVPARRTLLWLTVVLLAAAGLTAAPGVAALLVSPTVTAVSPASGRTAGGSRVIVTGTGFNGVRTVRFGTVAGLELTVLSATRLKVTAPPHAAGVTFVDVTTGSGTSARVNAGRFTYIGPPAITAVWPPSGRTAAGTRVTITGANFVRVNAVIFGATRSPGVTVVSRQSLVVIAPAHTAGLIEIRVTTVFGASAAVTADHYTYVAPPTVTKVAPGSGVLRGGTRLTVTGTSFIHVSAVSVGGVRATALSVSSPTALAVTAPAHAAGPVNVQVTTSYGTSALTTHDRYSYGVYIPTGVPMPVDAVHLYPQMFMGNVACAAVESCVAVGSYIDDHRQPDRESVIETLTGRVWSQIVAPLPPGFVRTQNNLVYLILGDVSCGAVDSCVATGSIKTGSQGSLLETLSGGAWHARLVPFPSDTGTAAPGPEALAVSCWAAGKCTAVGAYNSNTNTRRILIETLSGGVWSPSTAALPADANTTDRSIGGLSHVYCGPTGSCVAVGDYRDIHDDDQALVATESAGVWTVAKAPHPADAVPSPQGIVSDLSCASPTSCVATGIYTNHHHVPLPFLEMYSNGTWSASAAPLPSNAAGSTWRGFVAELGSVSCPAPGTCTAVGNYVHSAEPPLLGFADTLSNGVWTARELPQPDGSAGLDGPGISQVDCSAARLCTAVGTYRSTATGSAYGFVDTQTGAVWTSAPAPLPADALRNDGKSSELGTVSCPAASECVAAGSYNARPADTHGLLETGGR
jgi:IPT/TIG domain